MDISKDDARMCCLAQEYYERMRRVDECVIYDVSFKKISMTRRKSQFRCRSMLQGNFFRIEL